MPPVRTRFAPEPDRLPAHRGRAHGALQLGLHAPPRRRASCCASRTPTASARPPSPRPPSSTACAWLGIDWDEGPFRQSERARAAPRGDRGAARQGPRLPLHLHAARSSRRASRPPIATGREVDLRRPLPRRGHGPDCGPHTVRLRVPAEGALAWDDLVFGPSGQDAREIGDMIIRRSDGAPLYHLAVVVDDVDMGITHVIRGADHHSNTPLQLAIYRALGATPPLFAHVPLIVGRGRQEALEATRSGVGAAVPRPRAILPEAMRNWLVRLGWSHGDQEIFSREEIARALRPRRGAPLGAQADAGEARLAQPALHQDAAARRARSRQLLPFLDAAAGPPGRRRAPALERARRPAARAQPHARRDGAARALLRGADEIAYDAEGGREAPAPGDRARARGRCTTRLARARPTGARPRSRRPSRRVRARARRPRRSASSRSPCASRSPAAPSRRRSSRRSRCSGKPRSLAPHRRGVAPGLRHG